MEAEKNLDNHYKLANISPKPLTLVLMAGFAGAGKTTLARRLSDWLYWDVLNKDDLQLRRLAQCRNVKPAHWGRLVEQAGWEAFEELFELIEEKALGERQSVIIDASNDRPFIFEKVRKVLTKLEMQNVRAQLKIVLCVANKETRTMRLQERKSVFEPYIHELPTIFDDSELAVRFQHLPADNMLMVVDTNPPLRAYDWKVLKFLTQPMK